MFLSVFALERKKILQFNQPKAFGLFGSLFGESRETGEKYFRQNAKYRRPITVNVKYKKR